MTKATIERFNLRTSAPRVRGAVGCLLAAALSLPSFVAAQALVARDGTIDWNRYYSSDETNAIMRELARRHPGLTNLYSIGKSYLGKDLMLIEVTNEETGPASEKPALYLDGGIHAGELAGSAVALYVLGQLLAGYGDNQRITELLDTRAFYIRPKFNPDGADLALSADRRLRSTVRPWDEDNDGAMDEDPHDDLDGDGFITRMRLEHPDGDWKQGEDPRILVRRQPGDTEGPFYFVVSEGVDNDGDGEYNEDDIGGIDMNRNFPGNWQPAHIQAGAGPYAGSEPEVAATVKFIADHPNIAGIVHGHTSGGFVYRLPSSSDPATFDQTDRALIEDMGAVYTATTGRPVQPSSTDATSHRYGTLIGWAYDVLGIIGWVPEYVPPDSWITDYDGDGRISEVEALRFNDDELDGKYFTDWRRFPHPQLGEVEIGGWHTRFWGQNPPSEFLEAECEVQVPWILSLLEKSPRVEPGRIRVLGQANGMTRVVLEISNTGWLPTNMTERGAVGRETQDGEIVNRIVKPPTATLEVEGGVIEGPATIVVGHLGGSNEFSRAFTETSRTIEWLVRPTSTEMTVSVTVNAGPGGTARSGPVVYR
ncbi:MAG TPA: M14 family metallopeptidase [Longimicrobiales bacterium]|nr:M14 family metallopeptidase [Longimicrobiales bacterium]